MKWYVNAGPVKGIIDAKDPQFAAKKILKQFSAGKMPDLYTFVSEKGFFDDDGKPRKDFIYVTDILLNENK